MFFVFAGVQVKHGRDGKKCFVIVLVLRVSASVFCVCSDTDFSKLFCTFFGFVMQLALTEQRQNQFVYWRISRQEDRMDMYLVCS